MANSSEGLLVKVKGDVNAFTRRAVNALGAAADVEPILSIPAQSRAKGVAAQKAAVWLRIGNGADNTSSWDRAHALLAAESALGVAARQIEAIEPDLAQTWPCDEHSDTQGTPVTSLGGSPGVSCEFKGQNCGGGRAITKELAWNLGDGFSQLASARKRVGERQGQVLIAHLDTGYDPEHITCPLHLRKDLQKNFVQGQSASDAVDRIAPGRKLANRGHGTATLGLLAGNRLDGTSPGWGNYSDFIGGAPLAQVMSVRVANWVVRFTTGTLVQGFNHAREQGAHVLSMSMGGVSSQALVDAVNLAYDQGLVMVTAAGNHFSQRPSPKSIVFPARLKRVLAACGVMADGQAYTGLDAGTMQGNHGPAEKMPTALGAYTPNVPWAQIGCAKVVSMDGAGTSAATPQIAAAAALWLAEHWDAVNRYPERWMRVEAVRHALFTSAQKSTPRMDAGQTQRTLGQGVLRALAALDIAPVAARELHRLPPAQASWSWLNLLFGQGGVSLVGQSTARSNMLALELTQMAQRIDAVDEAIDEPERPAEAIPQAARTRYLEAALDEGSPSGPLRAVLEQLLGRPQAVSVKSAATATSAVASPPIRRKLKPPPVPHRRLRVFALDPSVAKSLESAAVNEAMLALPWDDTPAQQDALRPGPVGEYLEVVDVDPASDKLYPPVDLNDKLLLAQDGLAPSEGNPQFHQQMVYAVGMATIRNFERALGRRALWAPRRVTVRTEEGTTRTDFAEVRRLRIYPHALRTDNAYYSPDKQALLFGYFPANAREGDLTAPGSMVFTCLSSDIIAHEMSHALLDGLHRRFQEISNPDVPAFHEAFADIVALFQHFGMTELVRFEIARSRGDLSAAQLLGGLARQFGEGTSRRGPLRNYLEAGVRSLRYEDTLQAHDRGSVLVFAVYEAFLAIVSRRTADLIGLATGGTGVLPDGALHPDLVARLTKETCKAATHVLNMCIRTLDYCPAIDITFGEYLRALITADIDLVPDDDLGYRIAFMESFRRRGILPRDVRTISAESLTWNTPEDASPAWLADTIKKIDLGWDQDVDRSAVFKLGEKNRWSFWNGLRKALRQQPEWLAQLGLLPDLPRYNADGTLLKPANAGETTFDVYSVRPARRVGPDGSFRTDIVAVIHQRQPVPIDGKDLANGWFWFRGGATLIIDPKRHGQPEIRYSIIKNSGSASRRERQRQLVAGASLSPLRELYFGHVDQEPFAMMHAQHDGAGHG